MEARVKLLGHPVHQMLIVLPLGMLTGVVLFDLVYLVTGSLQWPPISYWLIVAGVLSGLVAAVFGFLDWGKIPEGTRAKHVGRLHGPGNMAVVALFTASWFVRGEAQAVPPTIALVLSFAAGGLAMGTAWLGGELVDRLGVGVDDGAHLDAPSSLSGRPAHGGSVGD